VDDPERKFKIGDLVKNDFPLELGYEELKVEQGEIGLIVGTLSFTNQNVSGYDYVVLIKGEEVFFFEDELSFHKPSGEKK
jgi:hypothetical protein